MAEVRNRDGFTPSSPCGYVCSRFDLDAWNDEARLQMQRAQDAGADVTDLRMVELASPLTLSPFTDLRSAIDRSAAVAQASFDRFLRVAGVVVPAVPEPSQPSEPWQWPTWPTLPSFQLPTIPPWLWVVAALLAAEWFLPKRRR